MRIFFKIFGLFIAVGRQFGNCFAPALVLEWYGVRRRVSSHSLTRRWFRFGWNSEHIAQRFGKCEDHSNYGGPVEFYSYRGILGTHQAL
jgi:hypothetical protein